MEICHLARLTYTPFNIMFYAQTFDSVLGSFWMLAFIHFK